jgi:hypothetical protein
LLLTVAMLRRAVAFAPFLLVVAAACAADDGAGRDDQTGRRGCEGLGAQVEPTSNRWNTNGRRGLELLDELVGNCPSVAFDAIG